MRLFSGMSEIAMSRGRHFSASLPNQFLLSRGLLRIGKKLRSLATHGLLLTFAGVALHSGVHAQTTTGNAATGSGLYTTNCAGCHVTPPTLPAQLNAANAVNVIKNARANGMGAPLLTDTEYADIAAHIQSSVPEPNPTAGSPQAITYNTATAFTIPNIKMNSATDGGYGQFSAATTVTGPTKGAVVFAATGTPATVLTATYTPTAGQTGADSFTYKVTGTGPIFGAYESNVRTVNVNIAVPPAPVATARAVSVPYNTVTPINLSTSVSGVYTSIEIMSAPTKGTGVTVGVLAGTTVTYTPNSGYIGADSFTFRAVGSGGNSATVTATLTVSTQPSMTVPLNTATSLNLAPYIVGTPTGIAIGTNPAHGIATVSGTTVTYTPNNNYFGTDSFTFIGYTSSTTAAPATVLVTVTGRPDPSQDTKVIAIITSQVQAVQRFARAQISNFQSRMESLHRGSPPTESSSSASFNARSTTPSEVAARAYAQERAPGAQNNLQPSGQAYRPAASFSSDPAAAGVASGRTTPGAALGTLVAALTSTASPSDSVTAVGKAIAMATTVAQTSTLNLSSSTGGTNSSAGEIDIWTGGNVRFGSRDAGTANGASFTSDGISVGADYRVNDKLAVGMGFGIAKDRTDIGTDGSVSNAKSATIAAYGSYQPAPNVYIDGLLGYGTVSFATDRFVTPLGQFANSRRTGDFLFGSLAAGYEMRTTGLLISPYTRLDLASHRLNSVTETGAGVYSLNYASQRIPSVQMALGLRAESAHEIDYGYVAPRLRVEFQHDFKGEQPASISYADQIGGTSYLMPANTNSRNSLVMGVGADFVYRSGLTIGFDYQRQRASSSDTSQAIFVKVSQSLDGRNKSLPTYAAGAKPFGVNLDFGVVLDDNVTRASTAAQRYEDVSYSVNASKSFAVPLNDNMRVNFNAAVGAEKFKIYSGLDRMSISGEAELQYRTSGDFGAPIYGVFANLTGEEYESNMRDGQRLSVGLSLRKPITDRLTLYAAIAKNMRYAKSDVFNTRDYSGRINFDYAITPSSTMYLTGEYRRGDVVSSGLHTLGNVNIAQSFQQDDAFTRHSLYAYRVRGQTFLLTTGLNIPLGAKDSLDFSYRRVLSRSMTESNVPGVGAPRYFASQFSIVYLTSF
jgi:uncharacterized protein YhjY with autotransporter beta-barrel domain/mono/diheme cytochrome c family protein